MSSTIVPPHRIQRAWPPHDDTALFFGCPDPDETYEYLRDRGVAAKPPSVTGYGMKQLWLKDPDGYTLCLQRPAP